MEVRRKIAMASAVAIIAFVIGAFAAHLALLPRFAERMIVRTGSRHGLAVSVGKTTMLGPWVRFSDVVACSIDCSGDDPFVVSAGLVRILPDVAGLFRGRIEPKVVDVSGVKARIDLARSSALSGLLDGPKTASSTKGRSGRLPEVRADGVDLEVKIAENVVAHFSGASAMPGSPPSIDLGATTFEGFGIEMESTHFIVEMGPKRTVRLVSPKIAIAPAVVDVLISPRKPEAGGAGAVDRSLASMVLAQVPRIEFSGASVHVPPGESSGAIDLGKLKGSFETHGSKATLVVIGEAYGGPIRLEAEVDGAVTRFEADTPQMPASILSGHIPIPDSVGLDDAEILVDGSGVLDRSKDRLVFDGILLGTGITVTSGRLALEPVTDVHVRLDGHLEADGRTDTLLVASARVDACGIPVDVESASLARLADGYRILARGRIPHTSCQELFSALPFEMRSSLPGFQFDGELGMGFDVRMDWDRPDEAEVDIDVDNRCTVVSGGSLKLDKFGRTFVHHVKDKVGEHDFVMGPGSDAWVDLEQVAPHMSHVIVTTEDGGFYKHKGISLFAIERAIKKNLAKGSFAFGASTITMQLVKNLFLTRDKTISRKLQEMILSFWVENGMDKDQILELYLNVVEFGPAVYGIRNASLHYFGKEPSGLTLLECAFLASVLPNPVPRHRFYEQGGITDKWRAVLVNIVTKMYERGYITEEEWKSGIEAPFAFSYPTTVPGEAVPEGQASPSPQSPFPDFSAE